MGMGFVFACLLTSCLTAGGVRANFVSLLQWSKELWFNATRSDGVDLERSFSDFCEQHDLYDRHLVLGVSGGMDSMVLLHLCIRAQARRDPPFSGLSVVHVDHGLRPNAHQDAEFVLAYCRANGIDCDIVSLQIVDDFGEGVEAAARRARYQALCQAARNRTRGVCMVAHHRRDQLETFLLRWMRGASLSGLGAMRDEVEFEGVGVYRPLLDVPYESIGKYAARAGLSYVTDETNSDSRFLRNRIRNEVLPVLDMLQPDLEARTSTMVRLLQTDDDYLKHAAEEALREVVRNRTPTCYELSIIALNGLHLSLQRRAIHILLNCLSRGEWGSRHVSAVLDLSQSDTAPSAEIDLPHGVAAWRNYGLLYIGHRTSASTADTAAKWLWDVTQSPRFTVRADELNWRFRTYSLERLAVKVPKRSLWQAWLPDVSCVEIEMGVATSTRLRPLGLGGSKKLQDLFSDRKIPRSLRGKWPVVRVNGEIVWVPGVVRTDAHLLPAVPCNGRVIFSRPPSHLIRNMDM